MSQRIVCKFGGSSVADAGQFKKIKAIVESDKNRKVIVVSAPGKRNPKETKLTDLLYSTYDLASKGLDFSTPWNLIRQRYDEICNDLGLADKLTEDLDSLEDKLKNHPESVSTDFLVSRGEFLCARLMAKYLGANFVDTFPLITFDDKYRITPKTYEDIAKTLSDENQLYVLPGFYGSNLRGEVKTFSRGGSDITGAILANGIDAAKYENWTDEMLDLWIEYLEKSEAEGRNLLSEKYARMMQYTDLHYYNKHLKPVLPATPVRVFRLINEIVEQMITWEEEFAAKYPLVSGTGRPIRSDEDYKGQTSLESYARGELETYPEELLIMYRDYIKELASKGESLAEKNQLTMVNLFGYDTIQEAEDSMK